MKIIVTLPDDWSEHQIAAVYDVFLDQSIALARVHSAMGFPGTVSIDVEP